MDFRGRGMGRGREKEGPALHLLFKPCERQFFIDFFSISRWTHGVGVITQHFEVASSGERRTSLGSHAEIAGSIPAGSYIALFAPLYALCISALNVYIYSSHIGAHLPLQVGKSLPKSSSGPSRVRVRVSSSFDRALCAKERIDLTADRRVRDRGIQRSVAQGLSGFRVPNRYHEERPVVTPSDPVRSMNHVIAQRALCASGGLRRASLIYMVHFNSPRVCGQET